MRRVKRANLSWAFFESIMTVDNSSPDAAEIITQDEENSYGILGRAHRIVGCVNIQVLTTPGANLAPGRCTVIGCAIGDQNSVAQTRITTAADADKRWLAREVLGAAPEGTGLSGTVVSFLWTHRFDWRLRRNGVEIRKDDALSLHLGVRTTNPSDSYTVAAVWYYCFLMES